MGNIKSKQAKQNALPVVHSIPPLFDSESRILILGSFPSVKSRQEAFFYAHPQNRFWRVLAEIFHAPVPQSIEEKKALILSNHLALWDVIGKCRICGSSDSSIKEVQPNDLGEILQNSKIASVFCNGKTAGRYYEKYLEEKFGRAEILPSTSPANASWNFERLCKAWKKIKSE